MSHSIFTILAQTASASPAAQGPGSNPTLIVWMVCIFVILYFTTIRPQSKRQKEQEAMIKGVKTGDKVITSSGIHGMVSNIKDTTVILKIADNVKIELEKSNIGTIVKRDETEPASATASAS